MDTTHTHVVDMYGYSYSHTLRASATIRKGHKKGTRNNNRNNII